MMAATTRAVAVASAPELDDERVAAVTAYLEDERQELGVPGLAAVLVADGEAVLEVGLGTADEAGTPVTPQTPFLLASLSKSVTAVAVMQLVDEGLVDLDEPVTTYLPELAPGGDDVTVTDLMHHRAGVPARTDGEAFVGQAGSSLERNAERVADELHLAGFEYSNSSYDLLALLVQRVAGTSFEDYLQEHVFGPLGMQRSSTDPARAEAAGLATGHDHWLLLGYRPHAPRMPDGLVGSYRMFSTAHDLGLFLDAQLGAGVGGDVAISDAARTVLHTGEPATGRAGYGGGLFVVQADAEAAEQDPLRARTFLLHDGSAVGYRSALWLWPEEQVGFAVLANANDQADEQQLVRVANNVQRLLLDVPPVTHSPPADPLHRWGKQALALLVLAQLLASLAVVPALVRRRRGGVTTRRGRVVLAVAVGLDLLAVAVTVVALPRALESPLRAILTVPDMRLMILTALVVAAFGAVLLALWVLPSAKRPSTPVRRG